MFNLQTIFVASLEEFKQVFCLVFSSFSLAEFLRFSLILIIHQQTFELKVILILIKKYCMGKRTRGPKARQSYLFPPLVLTKNGRRGGGIISVSD